MPNIAPRSSICTANRRALTSEHDRVRCIYAIVLCATLATGAARATTLTQWTDFTCTQQTNDVLQCDYRLRDGGSVTSAVATLGEQVLDGNVTRRYPEAGETSAILLLVDTSDPARQAAVARISQQIATLVDLSRPHHRLGLASFDTDLTRQAGFGASAADLRRAAAALSAKGRTTELYRNVREAVRLLAAAPDTRKALVVFSDGLAEDLAYDHDDVVELAREQGVMIHAIGYSRSIAQSVALQTLRKLSDETGGIYVQASDLEFSVAPADLAHILTATDSGGRIEFDLQPLIAAGVDGTRDLTITFHTAERSLNVITPVRLPSERGENVSSTVATPGQAAATPAPARPPMPLRAPTTRSGLWFIVPLGVLLFTLLALGAIVLLIRRKAGTTVPKSAAGTKPLAYVIMDDEHATRHVIDKTPWRIGRGRNNDLVTSDHSVSRVHAEIRCSDEGQLVINDLESMNGVFVNDNRVTSQQLREGDAIDVGDVRMRFTLHDEDYEQEEATVLVRTRTPL